jgi:hypothetical protein
MSWSVPGSAANKGGECNADAETFCKDVQRGEGRVVRCLEEHAQQLSPGCRQEMTAMQSKMKGFAESCKDDIAAYCKDIKPGEGRIVRCLRDHEQEISSPCKSGLPNKKEQRPK